MSAAHDLHRVLRFKHHLRPELVGEDRVFLVSERERFMLLGRLHALVVPLVDGRRTIAGILTELSGRASPPELLYTLTCLEEAGYLTEATRELHPASAGLWEAMHLDACRVADQLATTPVSVETHGPDPRPLIDALTELGLEVRAGASVCAYLTDDYLAPDLEAQARRMREQGTRWMLIKPSGAVPWLGPMLRPGEGPCWACLAHRLRANRPVEVFIEQQRGNGARITPPLIGAPPGTRAALNLAALALARWIAEGKGPIDDSLLALDLSRFQMTPHAVMRRPNCRVCGDPGLVEARVLAPVVLERRPRRFTEDGGHRCITPEETFARLEHLISPITGVVSSLGPVAGRDHPLRPVYGAVHFIGARDDAPSFDDFHVMSAGKGRTPAQARASAMCEALERWSFIFQGDEPRVRARLADLGGDAVHPAQLLGFSEAQYRRRDELNARCGDPRRAIPLPFDERVEIDWTPCWSLTHARRRYLPTAYCYARYPAPPEARFCGQDSNGHAAGNCLEEAILQGFLELVERDAAAIWWYGRVRRPAVHLGSFGEPYFEALVEHHRSLGWKLWVLDLTHDLGIPVAVALGYAIADGRFCVGFGCHPDARLAVQRALTEYNQLFDSERRLRPPWEAAAIREPAYLFPDESVSPRKREDFPEVQGDELAADVLACVEAARRAGLEVLVLDQTRPDVPLCAAKVVVPGLRHLWPRFGPGRLYDVPVHLGWRERALGEDGLNPVPLYL